MKRTVLAATLLLSACAPAGLPQPTTAAKSTPRCVTVVANALAKGDPVGLWNCLSADARAHYFYDNGWHDDRSVASTLSNPSGDGLDVLFYDGNPLPGKVWLLYAAPDDGHGQPNLNAGQGLKITLDQSGHISKIE